MSGGKEHILANLNSSSEDDDEIVIIEDCDPEMFETIKEPKTILATQPNTQNQDENHQQPLQMAQETEGVAAPCDQRVPQTSSPVSHRLVKESSLRRQMSTSEQDYMISRDSAELIKGYYENKIKEFQRCCLDMQEHFEQTNKKFGCLSEIFSEIQRIWELLWICHHERESTSLPERKLVTHAQANPSRVSLPLVAHCALQNAEPESRQNPLIPDIVSAQSFQQSVVFRSFRPSSSSSSLSQPAFGAVQAAGNLSSAYTASCSAVPGRGSMGQDARSRDATPRAVRVPPGFHMSVAAASGPPREHHTGNFPHVMGNNLGQHRSSPFNSFSDSDLEDLTLLQEPARAETNLRGNTQRIHSSALVRRVAAETSLFSVPALSSRVGENTVPRERPRNTDSSLGSRPETMIAQPSLQSGTERNSTSVFHVLSSVDLGPEARPQRKSHPTLRKSGHDQNNNPESSSDNLRLGYFGNPDRCIQIPLAIIMTAKSKRDPRLSAKYLIHHLFTYDVLMRSNINGNVEQGIHPLDSDRIGALREFLQENYTAYDLSENGSDWKLCVKYINNYIFDLVCFLRRNLYQSRPSEDIGVPFSDKEKPL